MRIIEGGLDDPRVIALLDTHVARARAETARGSAHALDHGALKAPDITFWSGWDGEQCVAVGALRALSRDHGEIKSMHTAEGMRGRGLGSAMVRHIVDAARGRGMTRVSLETGSWPYFTAARALYARHGFVECAPFGDYKADPNSVFMTLELVSGGGANRFIGRVCLLLALAASAARAQAIHVTLLGTGTPIPRADRFGPGILVEAGQQRLLFDAGRGVPIRLAQAHVPIGTLTAVFLTHLHSDHTVGLPDLWLTGWLANPQFGHRTTAMRVYGPHGTRRMMNGLRAAFAEDIRIREADEKLPPAGIAVVVREIGEEVVYDSAGVKVTAFLVDHGDLVKPAFGYRIDYGGHAIVLSGDTRPSRNLVMHARGADLLVHEVAMGSAGADGPPPALQRVLAHHTSPEDAGRIFAEVKPRLAAYSHVALSSYDANVPPPTTMELVRATRTTYDGPLVVGADLMSFDVGDSVTVHSPPSEH